MHCQLCITIMLMALRKRHSHIAHTGRKDSVVRVNIAWLDETDFDLDAIAHRNEFLDR